MKFDEVLKQLEPSMAVPMYPKSLLIDFMRKAYDEGFKDCAKAKLNVTTISDCPIKNEWHDLRKDPNDLPDEPNEKMSVNETWVYVKFFDNTYGLVDKGALNNYSGAIAWCELPTFEKE